MTGNDLNPIDGQRKENEKKREGRERKRKLTSKVFRSRGYECAYLLIGRKNIEIETCDATGKEDVTVCHDFATRLHNVADPLLKSTKGRRR
jgi:hypothetical protein